MMAAARDYLRVRRCCGAAPNLPGSLPPRLPHGAVRVLSWAERAQIHFKELEYGFDAASAV
jgi:hypothetical protein